MREHNHILPLVGKLNPSIPVLVVTPKPAFRSSRGLVAGCCNPGIGLAAFSVPVRIEAPAFLIIGEQAEETAGDRDVLKRHCGLDRVCGFAVKQQRGQQTEDGKRQRSDPCEYAQHDHQTPDDFE